MSVILSSGGIVPQGTRQRLQRLKARLFTERASFDSHWQDIGNFMMPRRTRFWPGERNQGGSQNKAIIDSTGKYAARTGQSGLHSGLTSPARPWMRLSTPNPLLAENAEVKEWLHVTTQAMRDVFQLGNLYNALPVVYGDVMLFGTAAMAIVEDAKDVARCINFPLGSYAVAMDSRDTAAVFVVEYERTVRQVVEEFGYPFGVFMEGVTPDWRNISSLVKLAWDNKQWDTPVQICWVVERNQKGREDALIAKDLPWSSTHFELDAAQGGRLSEGLDADKLLKESGFHEFPIMVPRWDVTGGDSYGRDCPGMTALGDVKALQIMQKRKAQAVEKGISPPLVGPSIHKYQKVSALPSDITFEDIPQGMAGLRPIYEVRLEGIQHLTADIRETQFRIKTAFYETLFTMIASSDQFLGADRPTAREIDERHEEKMTSLGPVLERLKEELHDPLVDRYYGIMERRGLIPQVPEALNGVRLKVENISILHQAQKLIGVTAQDRFLQSIIGLSQTSPDVLDRIDMDHVVDSYGELLGVDPRLIRPLEEAIQLREQRQQAQAQQAAAEQAKLIGQGAQAASQASLEGDTVLRRLSEGVAA